MLWDSWSEATVSFASNLTSDPEVRYTESGIAREMFRVAVSARREVDVMAEELGPSLRWATATTTKTTHSQEH